MTIMQSIVILLPAELVKSISEPRPELAPDMNYLKPRVVECLIKQLGEGTIHKIDDINNESITLSSGKKIHIDILNPAHEEHRLDPDALYMQVPADPDIPPVVDDFGHHVPPNANELPADDENRIAIESVYKALLTCVKIIENKSALGPELTKYKVRREKRDITLRLSNKLPLDVAGEIAKYAATGVTPSKAEGTGTNKLYVYLYEDGKRIPFSSLSKNDLKGVLEVGSIYGTKLNVYKTGDFATVPVSDYFMKSFTPKKYTVQPIPYTNRKWGKVQLEFLASPSGGNRRRTRKASKKSVKKTRKTRGRK